MKQTDKATKSYRHNVEWVGNGVECKRGWGRSEYDQNAPNSQNRILKELHFENAALPLNVTVM